jgi:hypothetical protein
MKRLDLKIPETWNHLSRKQLLYVCRLYILNLTELKFKTWVFIKFTGIKALPHRIIAGRLYYFFRKYNTRFSLTPDELLWFLHSVDYLLSESKLTINHFPVFRILGKRFFGPSNNCYNISVMEFLLAEQMLEAFNRTHQLKYLRLICAILYRTQRKPYNPNSPDYNGDRREPFNDFIFKRRERWFRLLSKPKLYIVYIFFVGCRNALIEKHPYLFSNTQVSSEPVNYAEALKQVLISLNQGDITKNREIQQTQVWEAFGQLNEMARQVKQIKKR